MREALLGVVSAGVFDHTIAAFWQFIIYMEVVLRLREMILPKSKNNMSLQNRIRELEEEFSLDESVVSGDFTSRLETAVREVIRWVRRSTSGDDLRQKFTNAMFERPIPKLREYVSEFSEHVEDVTILIDDLDKGWPPRQVEAHDVSTIKHLIETLNRIQRYMGRKSVSIRHLVFLRSDIYERLVEQTSDRGKYNVIKVDWSDPAQLKHLLKQRVVFGLDCSRHEEAWAALNPTIGSTDAISEIIASSLRRPRFLIDVTERVLSFAINRGRAFVTKEDVEDGVKQMSLYLVSDFAYEMRDVAGTPPDLFYSFIGKPDLLTEEEIAEILSNAGATLSLEPMTDLLLWYGFLGIVGPLDKAVFIYDVAYDIRRLEAVRADRANTLYAVNQAFLKGLEKT